MNDAILALIAISIDRLADATERIAEAEERQLEIAEYDHALIRQQFEYQQQAEEVGMCEHPLEARLYEEGENVAGLRVDCGMCGATNIKHGNAEAA